jgi:rod shape-determining protein MreC
MEHTPPPFFKRGPAPLVRLFFFASLSLALLVLDARFHYAEGLRSVLALAAYPLQRAATAPVDFLRTMGDYFSTQAQLFEDNATLRAKNLALSQAAQRYETAEAEAAQLRRLIGAAEKLAVKSTPAEILYGGRDPYSHKIFINLGERQGVKPGSPVADEAGVVGQVTRSIHSFRSHADHRPGPCGPGPWCATVCARLPSAAGPRHARAAVHAGNAGSRTGPPGHLRHRRHLPAGLPVATVVRIERDAEHSFARVICRPVAGSIADASSSCCRTRPRGRRGPRKRSRARSAARRRRAARA